MNKLSPILLYILICAFNFLSAETHKPINYFQGAQIVQIVGNGNEIWFATNGRGLLRFNKQNETWYQINSSNSGLKQDQLYCVAVCDDYIWAGSSDGLWILNRLNNNWSLKKFSKGGPFGQWVRALYYDNSQKILWVGRFKFLSRFDLRSKSW
ncbi:MAG: hypothetical protein N3A61_03670, partial [Ignavibacteria bacterium]|nr:hypothetical protein [Ignavibacteria bacterium]